MAEAWPESLPCRFVRGSMTRTLGDNLLRTDMDTGPAKLRPRSTAAPQPLTGTMRMTTAQIATLKEFYDSTLLEGALAFTFPVMGEGGVDQLCRFTKPPSWQDIAPARWSVSLELEILP